MLDEIKAEIEDRLERRREEVAAAMERGEVAEPFSLTTFFISLAVSAALSTASYFISRAFAPKPPIRRQGEMSGGLQIMQSEQGLMIPEVYGRDPGDGHGGCRLAPIIPWTSGIRRNVTVTRQEVGGGKGPPSQTVTTENVAYDLDIALLWSTRGPAETIAIFANADTVYDGRTGRITGVLDETVDTDDDYDQDTLPDPTVAYERPADRHNGALVFDGDGVGTGVVLQGSYSSLADYPGSDDQPVDPTIQAETDGRLGSGSTPAYRGRHYTKLAGFQLTRWGGILPNFTGVHQHETIATLEDLCDAMCERVGMESGDYDFSDLAGIDLRGLLIAGRRYQPREVLEVCARVFNFYFCETVDGQLVGRLQDEAVALTIADTEIGWIAGELDEGQPIPELGSNVPDEMTLPRRIDVKYVDPEKEFEPNLQTAARQITTGVDEQSLEVQITMLADEARAVAERELYQEHVEGTKHRLSLPWTYLYLDPGRVIQINRAEGFSHTVRASGIKGGVSLLDVDGYAIETAVYTQPAVGDGGTGFEQPPVPIPAMSILVLLDLPPLRDIDESVNEVAGFQWGACPRTGDNQTWPGSSLWVNKVGWEQLDQTTLPATIGVIESVTGLTYPDSGYDTAGEIVIDFYGANSGLESVTDADIALGANTFVLGSAAIQAKTVALVSGNQWSLTDLLHGARGTAAGPGTYAAGDRAVLVNEAIRFVRCEATELNVARDYRAVTAGQSLDDAATVPFTWTGASVAPAPTTDHVGVLDAGGNWQISGRGRDYGGRSEFVVRIPGATPPRTIVVEPSAFGLALLYQSGGKTTTGLAKGTKHQLTGFASNEVEGSSSLAFNAPYVTGYFADPFPDAPVYVHGTWEQYTSAGSATYTNTLSELAFTDDDGNAWAISIRGVLAGLGFTTSRLQVLYTPSGLAPGVVYEDTNGEASGTRYTVEISNQGLLRFYRNWTGVGSTPFYSWTGALPVFPVQAYAQAAPRCAWRRIGFIDSGIKFVAPYTVAEQVADFGSAQTTLTVEVYQRRLFRDVTLDGHVTEVTF